MTPQLPISIVITTYNRSSALRRTLEGLAKARIAPGWRPELILVDNGSSDDTTAVVQSATFDNMQLRYLYEPRKGKSNALNAALLHAIGELVLFTDAERYSDLCCLSVSFSCNR